MAFADDIAGDYVIFDGGESVTLRQVRSTGGTNVSITNAINQPMTRRLLAALGNVNLDGQERVWSLNDTQVGSVGVAPGDKITDASSNLWEIIYVSRETLGERWDCVCRLQLA